MKEAAAYGDISTVSVKPILICLVVHPDLNREVLVTNHQKTGRGRTAFEVLRWSMGDSLTTTDGAYHLKQRRLIQPQFHRRRIENYAGIMTDFASHLGQNWSDGASVDIEQEMREMALRIIVNVLFSVDLPDAARRIGAAFSDGNDYTYVRLTQPPFLRKLLHRLPLPSSRRFKRSLTYLDDTVYAMIEERRQSGVAGDDLLSLLLEARYEDATSEEDSGMSDQQVRDEVVSLYIAGFDTIATTLTWCFYLLSEHPEVERQFHAEIDDVLGGRSATLDDLPSLPYTEQVLTETLRLYPPFWTLGRMTYETLELGGYQIPPGVNLMVAPLVTQRDARWFDAPLEFRPERWTPEFKDALPDYAYTPFGGGPHKCIGEAFAWMEMKIVLATLGQHWRVHHDPRHRAVMQPHVTLAPKGGMPVTVERRNGRSI